MYFGLVNWIRANGVADVTEVAGFIVTIVGFGFTFLGLWRTRRAAQQALAAARAARDGVHRFELVVDFGTAIATLEEIKRLQREGAWKILPDRYAAIRKILVQLRNTNIQMTDAQLSIIQSASANLGEIERHVERFLSGGSVPLRSAKLNAVISDHIDELVAVLTQLKVHEAGGLP